MSSAPADEFKPAGDGLEQGTNADTNQDDYTSRTGQKQAPVPVQSDDAPVEDPIDANTADSDAQLGRRYTFTRNCEGELMREVAKDDADAIDKSNIVEGRTRGAVKNYREPGDEEGLGDPEDGRSAVAGGR